jgi:hypothetical protein
MKVSNEVIKRNREVMGNFMHLSLGSHTRFVLVDLILCEERGDYLVVCDEDRPNRVWNLSIRDYLSMGSENGILYKDLGDEIEFPESFYVTKCENRRDRDWEPVTCGITGNEVYDFTIVPTFE